MSESNGSADPAKVVDRKSFMPGVYSEFVESGEGHRRRRTLQLTALLSKMFSDVDD